MTAKIIIILLFCFIHSNNIFPEGGDKNKISKIAGKPSYTKFNINNISTFFKNDGESDFNPSGNAGFEFPRGSGKTAVFQSGLLWGGNVDGEIRVGGSTYFQGTVPGKILNSGLSWDQLLAEDPDAANVRIYRVRPDYSSADLRNEINDGEGTEEEIRIAYEKDWNEWPAEDGAPFNDLNSNGIYEPSIDIPGVPGADQTIWYVCNDIDSLQSLFMYGSRPMGIEEQVTIWGYNRRGALDNTLFRKYKLINKSNKTIEDMYVSMWHDSDVGYAMDDYVGCDTILNLTYAYNASEFDQVYEYNPPVVGFTLLEGPLVDSSGNSGRYNGRIILDKKNLPMTAHYFFIGGDPIYSDPPQGQYKGSLEWYNLLGGRGSLTGDEFPNPLGGTTTFPLSGDPIKNIGWIDGMQFPPGDRRAGLSSGPFYITPNDTQEIIIAATAALGSDNLKGINLLRNYVSEITEIFNTQFNLPPEIPVVQSSANKENDHIKISWEPDPLIENFDENGFQFQGYNVYQFSSLNGSSIKLATFDIIDGVTVIMDTIYDEQSGNPIYGIAQSGTDSGLKYSFTISKDSVDNKYFLPGKEYYFSVAAYAYNSDPEISPNNIESNIQINKITFEGDTPGPLYGDLIQVTQNEGTGDANIEITVMDPFEITGNNYEVFFDVKDYYRNENGDWIEIKKLGKKGDISPSSLSGYAIHGEEEGTIEVNFLLDLISPNGAWADGIFFTFPSSVNIQSAEICYAGGGAVSPIINEINKTVLYGNNDVTQNGYFHGGETIKIILESFTPPISLNYIIYDDGYDSPPLANAEGIIVIDSVGYEKKTEYHWNLRNLTTLDTLLKDQTVINGYDLYTGNYAGDPIVDGFKISLDIYYNEPKEFHSLNGNAIQGAIYSSSQTVISNYTIFGFQTSKALEAFGFGTEDINELQQDYEFRFTGILDTVINNGTDTLIIVREGTGQMATIFSTFVGEAGLSDHPLNPNPGSTEPFLVRIPFEVWNINQNKQVNLIFRDRFQSPLSNPFYAWNLNDRMYGVIVNSDYDENTVIPGEHNPLNELATWVLVFWSTHWEIGDRTEIIYRNPIKPGIDKFTFNTFDLVSVKDEKLLPFSYNLYQNFPNPFNPMTTIRFDLPQESIVKLEIFDILGRRVNQLTNKEFTTGTHEIIFNGSNLATGVYFFRIEAIPVNKNEKGFTTTKKLLLIK